jgi:hypothetical protein
MTTARNWIAGAIALTLTSACSAAGSAPASGPLPPEEATTVEVANHNWSDMNVYAVRSGMRYRLGTVISMTTERFRLPPGAVSPGAELRLLVDPIGGTRTFNTAPIQVSPGQRIEFTIQNHLAISSYSVWGR